MDWRTIQKAIDYIENNILDNLNYDEIAKQIYSSSYHFHRAFSMITGVTVGEYVRNRKLSLAGQELFLTKAKVIDIALKYGYESPESFTMAFNRFHGVNPSEARVSSANLKFFSPLNINFILKGGFFSMGKIIISNVKNAEWNLDANLNKQFDPEGKHKHSFEFQRSDISNFSHGGKQEVYFYTLQPGKANAPYHYHTGSDEVYYIISGQGTLKTPEGEKAVSEGDAVIMPANENGAHMLINTSSIPLVYINIKTVSSPDVLIFPETEKFAVFSSCKRLFLKWFKMDSDVNYLEGE